MGISRLLDETPSEIPTCSLPSSGLFDLFSPSLQEVVMLLLGYSTYLLIVHYSALLARASGMPLGQATRRPTTAWGGRMAPLPPPADAPRTASSDRRGTKPQTPCTQGFRSASLSYRTPLADAAFCNPIAPALSCRPACPLTPWTSPSKHQNSGRLSLSGILLTVQHLCKHTGVFLYPMALCAL